MGEYGVGLQSLSPVDFNRFVNNQSLFSPENSPRTMQDEILLEKSAAKQQQLSPSYNQISDQNGDTVVKNGQSDVPSFHNDDKTIENVVNTSSSPIEANSQLITSLANVSQNFWTPPQVQEDTFNQGAFQSINGTVSFQHLPPNALVNAGNIMQAAQISSQNLGQRRAITAQHNFPQRPMQQGMILNNAKNYPQWSNAHGQAHATLSPWTQAQLQQHHQHQRRSVPNMNIPAFAQLKNIKSFPQAQQTLSVIAPSKFRRSTSFPSQIHQATFAKPNVDYVGLDEVQQRENYLSYQERGGSTDTMKFTNFENQLLDIMRTTNMADQANQIKGKVPQFMFNDDPSGALVEDTSLDQTVPSLGSPVNTSPIGERVERFSRKVFVGGLPPDIDEEEITIAFRRFGPVVVDWPHKAESKSYFPPKGYSFLLFQDEVSVQSLIEQCIVDDDKLYWCVSSPTMKNKPVQIRPWNLSDSDFVMDGSQPLDPRKTIFVGGVPRPLRAVELAMIMDRLYGGVCYAGIDTDPELKYPKGAGRVAFSNQQSYIAAISARFVQLQHGDIDKRVEVKPYVLDDQMCDECQGARCGGKFAPFFCANVTCLQYYCEHCWAQIHSRPGREFHKPLVKEGADRPRAVPFRWC
ncbi:cytoplasmic polyadenylation element-binding protein 2-like isoform X2 [Mercenaria mercenaria]|uniref:cytoplasmic polyadenylation element-binding protein 2-like isoform X2 n=1 Tax=Mercenaria mercenaria TaxID=6596 RepID=UPI001E1DED1B|nr:cytoplasmic polyadenylation element-binding protein 2-like isoform X2 [Mercenaria mercenaria]